MLNWCDQGWGNRKGMLYLRLCRNDAEQKNESSQKETERNKNLVAEVKWEIRNQ